MNKESSYYPCNPNAGDGYKGITIRLEIAARLMASMAIDEKTSDIKIKECAQRAVMAADKLVEIANETAET